MGFAGKKSSLSWEQLSLGRGLPLAAERGVADLSAPLAALENPFLCQNKSCPENYCYNNGHCYLSQALACQPACTCPPAFTDTRCFLAGNNFTPTVRLGTTRYSTIPTSLSLGDDMGIWGQAKSLKLTGHNSKFPSGGGKL